MPCSLFRAAPALLMAGVCLGAGAQGAVEQRAAEAVGTPSEEAPMVSGVSTFLRGFDAGLTFSGVHDSSIGWYNLVTPAVSYRFSPRYSADGSVSIYPYRLAQNQSTTADPLLVATHGDLGDTLLGLHARFYPRAVQNMTTASLTVPSGNRADGLGTGHVTFDFDEHMEHTVRQTGFLLDIGTGDSSALFNRLIAQESSVGPIAHFQTGLVTWLPGRSYLQSVVYEQLPIGNQKTYATISPPPGSRPGTPSITVVTGRKVIEDNGFTTSVGIPVAEHWMLSGYYNRSLRLHLDTVSMGIAFVFRGIPGKRKMSLIDRALREAEGAPVP